MDAPLTPRFQRFAAEWVALAEEGLADGQGVAQFRRAWVDWLKTSEPEDIRAYLVDWLAEDDASPTP